MILTDTNIDKINFFHDLMVRGRYGDIRDITDTYNAVFADRPNFRPKQPTNCGSCLRHLVAEMYGEMTIALGKLVTS